MNIGDIAEMAGVSRAAVSRYLNNGYISAEKKERIRKVIEETGYKPSVMAQTLRTKKTKLIGVIIPRIDSDSISSIIAGIETSIQSTGYDMLLATTDNSPERELDFLRIFSANRVDGVILIATVFTGEHSSILKNYRIPVVIAGQSFSGFSCVYHEDFRAGKELTEYVISKGRRRIAYIGVRRDDTAVGENRFRGYAEALGGAGLPLRKERIATADFSTESGYERMGEIWRADPEIDAVICATDRIALGAMNFLREAGRSIPGDVSVAGFGDNFVSGFTSPPITTVRFRYRDSGLIAGRKILEEIAAAPEKSAPEDIRLGFELLRRGSV